MKCEDKATQVTALSDCTNPAWHCNVTQCRFRESVLVLLGLALPAARLARTTIAAPLCAPPSPAPQPLDADACPAWQKLT